MLRLRQILDLYACVRPVKYYKGIPSPVKHPERMNIVLFRENTEDVYAGIEWKEGTPQAKKLIDFLNNEMLAGTNKRVREDSGVGIKPISITGTKRLVRMAIKFALENGKKSVTIVHKGNIQKFTEGAFREWGYELATRGISRPGRHRARKLDSRQQGQEPGLTIEENGKMFEPGLEFAPQDFRDALYDEVKGVIDNIYCHPRQRRVEEEADGQRSHCRQHLPADRYPAG